MKSLKVLSNIIGLAYKRNFLALKKIFKAVIIFWITYRVPIQHMRNNKKRYPKTLVIELAQVQALVIYIITKNIYASAKY